MQKLEHAWIYALTEPVTDAVRYVGVTTDVRKRFSCHLSSKCGYGRVKELTSWIVGILMKNSSPGLRVLEQVPIMERYEHEERWIRKLKADGCKLINTVHVKPPRAGVDALQRNSIAGRIREVFDENGWDTPAVMVQELVGPQIHHFNGCNMRKENGRWITIWPGTPHLVPLAYINQIRHTNKKYAGAFSHRTH